MRIGVFGSVAAPGWLDLNGLRPTVAQAIRSAGGVLPGLGTGNVTIRTPLRGIGLSSKTLNLPRQRGFLLRTKLASGMIVVVQFHGVRLLNKWRSER